MVVNLRGIANTTSNTQQPKDIVIYQQLQKRSQAKFAKLSLISPMQRAGFPDFLLSYNILLSITILRYYKILYLIFCVSMLKNSKKLTPVINYSITFSIDLD